MLYCNSQEGLMWSASENMAVHAPTLRECVVQMGVDGLLLGFVPGFLQRLDDVIWMVPSCHWSFCWNKSTFAFNMFETFSKRNPFRDVQVWMQLRIKLGSQLTKPATRIIDCRWFHFQPTKDMKGCYCKWFCLHSFSQDISRFSASCYHCGRVNLKRWNRHFSWRD